jgi:Vanadium chloroperoxidase N-terminal domain
MSRSAGERLAHVNRKLATTLVLAAALVMSTFSVVSSTRPAQAAPDDNDLPGPRWPINGYPPRASDNAILKWDEELLQTIRKYPPQTGPTITSRALGVLHTATYDAWAAYDATAVPTMKNNNARVTDVTQRTVENKTKAISWAAYRVLRDLFPVSQFPNINTDIDYDAQMAELLGTTWLTDQSPARTIGEEAARAVIAYRHRDGANQLADEPGTPIPPDGSQPKPYSDYTGYDSTREWNEATDPWRWQPLCTLTAAAAKAGNVPPPTSTTACVGPNYAVQSPLTPQWKKIKSFALTAPNQFTPPGPPKLANGQYDPTDIETALADASNLTDAKKVTAEYWADGPQSEFPPGHWAVIAGALSRRNGHSLDTDAKMFFVLGNAELDAGISAWAAKYQLDDPTTATVEPTWDFWRPITAIRHHYRGKMINSWKGPYKGYGLVPAEQWLPYQALNVITPPFPEYTSGHSTFSGAGRVAIIAFTGTDNFRAQVTIPKGTSLFESGSVPATDVTLSWKNLLDASEQAGMSRRYGGIHFYSGDKHGRANGASVGYWVYDKATKYFKGDTSIQIPVPS